MYAGIFMIYVLVLHSFILTQPLHRGNKVSGYTRPSGCNCILCSNNHILYQLLPTIQPCIDTYGSGIASDQLLLKAYILTRFLVLFILGDHMLIG